MSVPGEADSPRTTPGGDGKGSPELATQAAHEPDGTTQIFTGKLPVPSGSSAPATDAGQDPDGTTRLFPVGWPLPPVLAAAVRAALEQDPDGTTRVLAGALPGLSEMPGSADTADGTTRLWPGSLSDLPRLAGAAESLDGEARAVDPDGTTRIFAGPLPTDGAGTATQSATQSATELERMRLAEEMFHRAMDLPTRERPLQVRAWCGEDLALRNEVLELLDADLQVEEVLASTPALSRESSRGSKPAGELEEEAWAGRVVDNYKLRTMLGRGGMGVVYLAEPAGQGARNTGEETAGEQEQKSRNGCVAIKFVRRSLRGSPALEHFRLERDTLAALQHPNIARLLDGGLTEDGVPYVVMEYIEGQRLDEVCDGKAVPPQPPSTVTGWGTGGSPAQPVPGAGQPLRAEQVTGLMIQLCDAVSFVHRNLVLHRDLKPGNVMVSADGMVKLLDFGTLKMLGPDESESAMTQAGMRPVTLRYGAPEHVLGEPVTTASDVYSLGVVLYRILAGRLPPGLESLNIIDWFTHLREKGAAGGIEPPSAVSKRPMPPALAADLDAITLKAMRYEPEARYTGADAMADDLRRALAGEPVRARGDSRRYRAGKLYQRNRGVVWAAAAAACVLLCGLLLMRHETRVAEAQERLAQTGVEQERALAHTLLFDYFDQLRALPGSTDAQKRAVTQALAYLNGLSSTLPDNAGAHLSSKALREQSARELAMDQVQGFTSMGSVLGNPYEDNLNQPGAATDVLAQGVALAKRLALQYPNDTDVLKAEATVEQTLGKVYFGAGDMDNAVFAASEAARTGQRLGEQATATAPDLAVAASVSDTLADMISGRDNAVRSEPAKAQALYEQALRFDQRALALDPRFFRARRGIAVEYHKLAAMVQDTDPARSIAFEQSALNDLDTFSPENRTNVSVTRIRYIIEQDIGMLDVRLGRANEGLPILEGALAHDKAAYAADPINDKALFDLASMESNVAESYRIAHRTPEALAHYQASVDAFYPLLKRDPTNNTWRYIQAQARFELAKMRNGAGAPDARRREQEAALALEQIVSAPGSGVTSLAGAMEDMFEAHVDPEGAWRLAQRLQKEAPSMDSFSFTACAQAAEAAGHHAEARVLAKRALDLFTHENVSTDTQRLDLAEDQFILREP